MAATEDEQCVQYVELLDIPYSEEEDQEIVAIQNVSDDMSHIITIPDDSEDMSQLEEVEYIEAKQIDSQHTIIVHEGRQYMIPTEHLHQAGNTIVLEENDEEMSQENEGTQYINPQTGESVYYTEVDSDEANLSGQYAVIKDGKLHIQETSNHGDDSEEIQEKLRVLEQSLCYKDDSDEPEVIEDDSEQMEVGELSQDDEENDALSQITGKNLITGQTISLSGFLEKIRRKGINEAYSGGAPRRGATARFATSQMSSEYVLVPPVNRRVVVGKTPDGRRLVGRILQIQKKLPAGSAAAAAPRRPAMRQPRPPRKLQLDLDTSGSSSLGEALPIPQCSALLDENVSRTLAGLMELESVSRSLLGHHLVVRHVQRRSKGGRVLLGTRRIAYYSGRMVRGPSGQWKFQADPPTLTADGIDLQMNEDSQQIDVRIEEDGVIISSSEETHDPVEQKPITLYLTVTQDEFGRKRTKVSIPQLAAANTTANRRKMASSSAGGGGDTWPSGDNVSGGGRPEYICQVCDKKFKAPGSLSRHITIHDPSLRPLQCLTCLARFTDESSLKKHLVLHSGLRPHVCTVCDKTFTHRGDLNFHMRTHDPVKRFRCDTCGRQFHRHSNLLRHVDIHRQVAVAPAAAAAAAASVPASASNETDGSEARQPPFTCDTCGCQYNFISSLTRHIVNNHMDSGGEGS